MSTQVEDIDRTLSFVGRSRKSHPGPVVHLSDNPQDPGKLLIGYSTGQLVLWDLKNKTAEMRWQSLDQLKSVSWNHEAKQFMCSHTDGSLTTWNVRQAGKPVSTSFPHGMYEEEENLRSHSVVVFLKDLREICFVFSETNQGRKTRGLRTHSARGVARCKGHRVSALYASILAYSLPPILQSHKTLLVCCLG